MKSRIFMIATVSVMGAVVAAGAINLLILFHAPVHDAAHHDAPTEKAPASHTKMQKTTGPIAAPNQSAKPTTHDSRMAQSAAMNSAKAAALNGTIVSLGDSITYGFNLPGAHGSTPSPDAYPFVLARLLHAKVIDLGVPRWTTDNLIKALGTDRYQQALAKASLVTLDIGSNDILHAFNNVLADYLQGKEPASLQPTIHNLEDNTITLHKQLVTILGQIRDLTNAPIVMTTIYNPAPDNTVLHDFVNPYIIGANQVIMRVAAHHHTLLYDAYDTINHQQWSLIRLEHIDIHPTISGQKALAAGFYNVWQNQLWNEPTYYAITTKGANIYKRPNMHAHTIGKITGIAGYPVLSEKKNWDKIAVNGGTGYVRRSRVTEILRLHRDVHFGTDTVLARKMNWRNPAGSKIQGLMVDQQLYVPIVTMARMAGRTVNWDNTLRAVEISPGDPSQIQVQNHPTLEPSVVIPENIQVRYVGASIEIGGEMVHLNVQPFTYQGNVYAPVDPVWTQLGGQITGLNGQFH